MRECFLLVVALGLGLSTAWAQQRATTGSLGGRVLDWKGGAVAGAKVIVTGPISATSVTTDEQGSFEVRDLGPGKYSVVVERSGFKTARLDPVEVIVGNFTDITDDLEIDLRAETAVSADAPQPARESGRLKGIVHYRSGNPAARLTVFIRSSSAKYEALTDESGKYDIELPADTYRVRVGLSHAIIMYDGSVTVETGKVTETNVTLEDSTGYNFNDRISRRSTVSRQR